jgi:RNA polymerase sigma-70 factor, ECF subfamily
MGHRTESGADFATEVAALDGYLRCTARKLVRNRSDVDDLVQDTIERALAYQHQFRAGTNLKAWTGSIMWHLFVDTWRKTPVWIELDPHRFAAPEAPEPKEIGPLDLLGIEHVRAAATRLPGRDRDLFRMAHFERVPYRELALRFQITVETVGTRLFRIRQKLRKILEAPSARLELEHVPIDVRRTALAGRPRELRPRDVRAVVVDHEPVGCVPGEHRSETGVAA